MPGTDRGTLTLLPKWALQASYGFFKQSEAGHPGSDNRRFTASPHYANGQGLSAMAGFSAKARVPGPTLAAFLGQAGWDATRHHTLLGRIGLGLCKAGLARYGLRAAPDGLHRVRAAISGPIGATLAVFRGY